MTGQLLMAIIGLGLQRVILNEVQTVKSLSGTLSSHNQGVGPDGATTVSWVREWHRGLVL